MSLIFYNSFLSFWCGFVCNGIYPKVLVPLSNCGSRRFINDFVECAGLKKISSVSSSKFFSGMISMLMKYWGLSSQKSKTYFILSFASLSLVRILNLRMVFPPKIFVSLESTPGAMFRTNTIKFALIGSLLFCYTCLRCSLLFFYTCLRCFVNISLRITTYGCFYLVHLILRGKTLPKLFFVWFFMFCLKGWTC